MKDYLKLGFTSPQHLYKAIRMSRKHLVSYFALIALILTLSMASVLISVMGALREDGQEITETLPAFEITDNALVVEEETESYVHQTDSFLFFFDPNDSIQEEEIDTNVERLNVPIGIGLMDDQFYLNIMGQPLPVSYEQIDGFTDADFREVMSEMGQFSPIVLFFIFVVTYLASSFSLLYEWLIIALFANILKTLFRIRLPFRKVARMALVALSVPTIIFAVFDAFGLFLPFTLEITIGFSVYFLYASLRNLKKNRTI
ncbi:Protein of unknown function [Alkalibacterium subtropicum]|uniref:Maltodextrin utilization protein YvdJ n=1 Tax=Alkalibacterium subtropicum TaxID=753702 RepID=A0A1I1LQ63_9LACT|nr:DUF1189 domain-containing protein [Alkalibacterium subtropicum]SFC74692.1 Protein of unknown function [Alkalibacterium subtropicum]